MSDDLQSVKILLTSLGLKIYKIIKRKLSSCLSSGSPSQVEPFPHALSTARLGHHRTRFLKPGFLYAIAALESTCPGDFDGDKDVGSADLAEYIDDSGGLGLDVFAINFGKVNCP